jgi:hypothetical protein
MSPLIAPREKWPAKVYLLDDCIIDELTKLLHQAPVQTPIVLVLWFFDPIEVVDYKQRAIADLVELVQLMKEGRSICIICRLKNGSEPPLGPPPPGVANLCLTETENDREEVFEADQTIDRHATKIPPCVWSAGRK